MWTTTFKHKEGIVVGMTHHFDNDVSVVVDLENLTIKQYYGKVCVKEYTLDIRVLHHIRFLENVAEEVNFFAGEGKLNNDKE